MLNETYRAMLNNKSVIRETFMYGRQRAAQIGNENVFDYSLGNPSVPCPPEFTEAMQTLLAQEEPVSLHGYCPSQGDPGFRTAVAAHLTETFGLPYAQKHIFPTTGAAGAIAHAIRAVTQPGDEVLTFTFHLKNCWRKKTIYCEICIFLCSLLMKPTVFRNGDTTFARNTLKWEYSTGNFRKCRLLL